MKTLLILISAGMLSLVPPSTKCIATWYNMHGARTASGTRMHRDSLTAAYNYASYGTKLRVINIETNDSCIITVTDRMGSTSRNRIDLSWAAFGSIAKHSLGRINVVIEPID